MGIKVNFSDVEVQDFDPIPAGTYGAKITDAEMRETGPNSKKPGSPMINWEFTIQDGQYAGRKQWTNTVIMPEALFGLKALLLATGRYTQEQLDGDLDFEIEDVIGSDVSIVVAQREYQGEMRNDVKRVKKAGASAGSGSLLP